MNRLRIFQRPNQSTACGNSFAALIVPKASWMNWTAHPICSDHFAQNALVLNAKVHLILPHPTQPSSLILLIHTDEQYSQLNT